MRAIQHLKAAKVLPSRVQALATTPGEGLHAWARQNAAAKRGRSIRSDAIAEKRRSKNEARQRALIHEVTITTRQPDGTRKARQRFTITNAVRSDIAALQARLTRLQKAVHKQSLTALRARDPTCGAIDELDLLAKDVGLFCAKSRSWHSTLKRTFHTELNRISQSARHAVAFDKFSNNIE